MLQLAVHFPMSCLSYCVFYDFYKMTQKYNHFYRVCQINSLKPKCPATWMKPVLSVGKRPDITVHRRDRLPIVLSHSLVSPLHWWEKLSDLNFKGFWMDGECSGWLKARRLWDSETSSHRPNTCCLFNWLTTFAGFSSAPQVRAPQSRMTLTVGPHSTVANIVTSAYRTAVHSPAKTKEFAYLHISLFHAWKTKLKWCNQVIFYILVIKLLISSQDANCFGPLQIQRGFSLPFLFSDDFL